MARKPRKPCPVTAGREIAQLAVSLTEDQMRSGLFERRAQGLLNELEEKDQGIARLGAFCEISWGC